MEEAMGVTGYEARAYADLSSIARSLEEMVKVAREIRDRLPPPEREELASRHRPETRRPG
jgi:hypothetical protein